MLATLLAEINRQTEIGKPDSVVEIVLDRRPRPVTTGEKRNDLLLAAVGEYTWFVDDDDTIAPDAISRILAAIETKPDVVAINGYMTTDGTQRVDWEIRLGHEYKAVEKNGKQYYLRFPNHITPMRREHALQVRFPHKTVFEDFEWASALKNLGLLKTQVIIDQPIYHYKFRTK